MKTCTDKECELIEETAKLLAIKYLKRELSYHEFTDEMNRKRNDYWFKKEQESKI